MEPVSLIVGALVAGAGAGVTETASQAVKDAYAGLKRLLGARFAGHSSAEVALTEHESDPETWEAPLVKALTATGADRDEAIVAAAHELLGLVDPEGAAVGKYTVDLRGASNVQVGDHNRQFNLTGTYVEGNVTHDPGRH